MTQSDVTSSLVPTGVVEWRSMRVKRVVKFTLPSEAAALSAVQDRSEFNHVFLTYMSGKLDVRQRCPWELGLQRVPGMLAIDARPPAEARQPPG